MPSQYSNRIVQWLEGNPGRQRTRDLTDGVSYLMTGRPCVHLREEDPLAVVYDTITKQLFNMTREVHSDYDPRLHRDGKGHWWLEGPRLHPLFDGYPVVVDHKPSKPKRNRTTGSGRNTKPERAFLPKIVLIQERVCAGCGKTEPRPDLHLWQADMIIPHRDKGKAKWGNVQALCWPCNNRKLALSMTELWNENKRTGTMWDEGLAKWAHSAAVTATGG